MEVREAQSFIRDLDDAESSIRHDLDPNMAASMVSGKLRASYGLNDSNLNSSQASRRLRKSQGSDAGSSRRKSSSKGRRKS